MKKAKFMLMSLAVLAAVGGSLAFKAYKESKFLYYFDGACLSSISVTTEQVGAAVNPPSGIGFYTLNNCSDETPTTGYAVED
jgi:hypothetical protein